MTTTFWADGAIGRAAVYTGSDDAPWAAPLDNINRVKIHSDLEMIGFHPTPYSGTISVPTARAYDDLGRVNLFAHGLGYSPLVLGHVTIRGNKVPAVGTVIVCNSTTTWATAVNIGSNATHVFATFKAVRAASAPGPIETISYTLHCLDIGINANGTVRRPEKVPGLSFDAVSGESKVGYINSKSRYLYKLSTGPYSLPTTQTIWMFWNGSWPGIYQKCGAYVCDLRYSSATPPAFSYTQLGI